MAVVLKVGLLPDNRCFLGSPALLQESKVPHVRTVDGEIQPKVSKGTGRIRNVGLLVGGKKMGAGYA